MEIYSLHSEQKYKNLKRRPFHTLFIEIINDHSENCLLSTSCKHLLIGLSVRILFQKYKNLKRRPIHTLFIETIDHHSQTCLLSTSCKHLLIGLSARIPFQHLRWPLSMVVSTMSRSVLLYFDYVIF